MQSNVLDQLTKVTKKRKPTINQKHKGKRGESWIADKLSLISGLHFERIYTSGASVGQSNSDRLKTLTQAQGESQLGDINSPEDLTHYFIWESKNYAELDFHNLLKEDFSTQVKGWLDELEYDTISAFTKMTNNTRPVVGFLVIKITRKGAWIIGNESYIKKIFKKENLGFSNVLYFKKEPPEILKQKGFENKYFMTEFERFIEINNKDFFVINEELKERLKKAKEAFNKIYNGEV